MAQKKKNLQGLKSYKKSLSYCVHDLAEWQPTMVTSLAAMLPSGSPASAYVSVRLWEVFLRGELS